YKIFAA
ncbi:hypothetical protein D047_2657B, partial [Vibrio parahaemolyticus VPTS-2010_2]